MSSGIGKLEGGATFGSLLQYLYPPFLDSAIPRWPPDVFALVAIALQRSGAYDLLISAWPPGTMGGSDWIELIERLALEWRKAWTRGQSYPLPALVSQWWSALLTHRDTEVGMLRAYPALVEALIQLCATADEASAGVGVPGNDGSRFDAFALQRLARSSGYGASLCDVVHPSRVLVLPKLHTPRTGISIRSLSHHLCACEPGEIHPNWAYAPRRPADTIFNLLVVPWPYELAATQFQPAGDQQARLRTMPPAYGFFDYVPPRQEPAYVASTVMGLFHQAESRVGRIDGIVLPELSVTPNEFDAIARELRSGSEDTFLIGGICDPGSETSTNLLRIELPVPGAPIDTPSPIRLDQYKHHRWCLDRNQVVQYNLGGSLDANRLWWESTPLSERKLHFVSMRPWLTWSALICEDLARRDPVDEVLRSVGPNLLIALLMDGPQLSVRWPARFATVLADDPGCSVLTLTSLGMASMCAGPGYKKSRVVALWRGLNDGTKELELPEGAGALVLSLNSEEKEEWTADGRSDGGATYYPILAGITPVTLSDKR